MSENSNFLSPNLYEYNPWRRSNGGAAN